MPKEHLKKMGIQPSGEVHRNLPIDTLAKKSVERGEGVISRVGALCVKTGKYTGRSPNDRFIVDDSNIHDEIDWGKVNVPVSEGVFDALYKKVTSYLSSRPEIFVFDGFAGADPEHTLHVRVVNELSSQNFFIQQLLRRPSPEEIEAHNPEWVVMAAPGCSACPGEDRTNSEAFIVVNFTKKIVIIGGSYYAGEIKKSIFSVMNYILPKKGVLPMHCSANMGKEGDVALFFGLSGTGKTTLSADVSRRLIGDDEHAWSDNGIFNFEGGCYAKCINLSKEREPQIWDAIKHGAMTENVVMDERTGEYDFDDASLAENSRVAYPIEHIPNADLSGVGGHPKTVIFLTADAFGVMPPVARLSMEQAMYHFMSGYTSKLAGTERGIIEPVAAFSAFFGGPFMPLKPMVYSSLLKRYLGKYKPSVFLVNTGWSGGPYGVGERMSLKITRQIVDSAMNGLLDDVEYEHDPVLNLDIPKECPGVPSDILKPENTWKDKEEYRENARNLAKLFIVNFSKFKDIPDEVINAGPKLP